MECAIKQFIKKLFEFEATPLEKVMNSIAHKDDKPALVKEIIISAERLLLNEDHTLNEHNCKVIKAYGFNIIEGEDVYRIVTNNGSILFG